MLWIQLILQFTLMESAPAAQVNLHGLCIELRSGSPIPKSFKKSLNDPQLDRELEAALKDPEQVRDAACVVANAKREKLLDTLLEIQNDRLVPEVFQALVRIRTSQNEKRIQEGMIAWLGQADREDSILRTLGALQVLGDLNWQPNPKALRGLLNSTIPEVRVGGHEFLFHRFDRMSTNDQADLMKEALKKDPLQVRVAAIRTYKSLTEAQRKSLKIDLKDCRKDEAPEVREVCP